MRCLQGMFWQVLLSCLVEAVSSHVCYLLLVVLEWNFSTELLQLEITALCSQYSEAQRQLNIQSMWITNWQEWTKRPQIFKPSSGTGAVSNGDSSSLFTGQISFFTCSNIRFVTVAFLQSDLYYSSSWIRPWNELIKPTLDLYKLVKQKEVEWLKCWGNFGRNTSSFTAHSNRATR